MKACAKPQPDTHLSHDWNIITENILIMPPKSGNCIMQEIGGAKRDRTADPLHAMQALSQLSYGPTSIRNRVGPALAGNW
jgi:hypothetical protein